MTYFRTAALALFSIPSAAALLACSGGDPVQYQGYGSGTNADGAAGPADSGGGFAAGSGNEPTNEVTGTRTEVVCTPGCTDEPYSPGWSCEAAKENCGQEWFAGACERTCGVCTGDEAEVCTEVVVEVPTSPNDPTSPATPPPSGEETVRPPGGAAPPPVSGGRTGWASRYWDCCMQHCSWDGNTGGNSADVCDSSNNPTTEAAGSACSGGGGYTCWSMAPWAVSDTLGYGYVAVPPDMAQCGQCYQLDFTGAGNDDPDDPGSVSMAGKTMIVQTANIGWDVKSDQFDLLIPGGGVGQFNACSQQWGKSTSELGQTYGGLLSTCRNDAGCLRDRCSELFADKPDLLAGCLFHADWMGGADNPKFTFAPVACPAALEQTSGMTD